MYSKIFAQIFDSSIAEDYVIRHVFMDLLTLANPEGVVDMTLAAIARRTNVPLEIVSRAIEQLMQPDAKSRSHEEDGRRIVHIDVHRDWGWRIVNFLNYRNLRDEKERTAYFKEYRARRRAEGKDLPKKVTAIESIDVQSVHVNNCASSASSPTQDSGLRTDTKTNTLAPKSGANNESHSKESKPEWWQAFWCAYPRHDGKADALKAFRLMVTSQEVFDGLMAQLAAQEWRDPQFIPWAQKFIKRKPWLDDPVPREKPRDQMTIDEKIAAGYLPMPKEKRV